MKPKYFSSICRTVLTTQRMMLIWLASVGLHYLDASWTMASLADAFWLQLAGFVMIVIGNLLYSDAIVVPSIRKMWKKKTYHEITSK